MQTRISNNEYIGKGDHRNEQMPFEDKYQYDNQNLNETKNTESRKVGQGLNDLSNMFD